MGSAVYELCGEGLGGGRLGIGVQFEAGSLGEMEHLTLKSWLSIIKMD